MSATRAACCMLCVTITIVYFALQLVHEILDARRRDRVQRGARLVHEQHVRLDGQRPRDAESLLLAAGESERARLEPILHLVPERRLLQRALDALVQVLLHPEHARPVGDVLVDRLDERIRLLEDHADQPANLHRIDAAAVQVLTVVEDLAATSAPGMRSFMRLKQRMYVLLPHPDGPMKAVT